jgi:hypothetical protein
MEELKKLIQAGNHKLPKSTAIFNMASATDCPSLRLELCSAVDENGKLFCYAKKSEAGYRPDVLPYRRRQEKFWLGVTAEDFAAQFLAINSRKRKPFTALRLNEAGDFHNQACVEKAEKIASILSAAGVACYAYTARKDLDYKDIDSLVVNGSGWTKEGVTNDFLIVGKDGSGLPAGYKLCPADCSICKRCLIKGSKTGVRKH